VIVMKNHALKFVFVSLVVLGISSGVARAASTGTIIGVVLDSRGNPAADVIVTAQQAAEKMRDPLQAKTDDKGEFKFEKVPEGKYNLKIRTSDGKSKAARTVDVTADNTTDVGKITMKSK